MRGALALGLLVVSFAAAGCGGDLELRTVPLATQPTGAEAVSVPFPPPPARADVIRDPHPDLKNPAWVDGQWMWRGRRWVWEPGQWVDLEPNQVYAPPYVVRRADGEHFWYVGVLRYDGSGPVTARSATATPAASANPAPANPAPATTSTAPANPATTSTAPANPATTNTAESLP